MKFIVIALALVACVMADVSELGYDYHAPAPVEHHEAIASVPEVPQNTYIPPAAPEPAPAPVAPQNTYIPPAAPAPAPVAPQNTYIPPAAPAPVAAEQSAELAQDGYRYKTVRRRVYRRRY